MPIPADLPQQVASALAEDVGSGDLTAALIQVKNDSNFSFGVFIILLLKSGNSQVGLVF